MPTRSHKSRVNLSDGDPIPGLDKITRRSTVSDSSSVCVIVRLRVRPAMVEVVDHLCLVQRCHSCAARQHPLHSIADRLAISEFPCSAEQALSFDIWNIVAKLMPH